MNTESALVTIEQIIQAVRDVAAEQPDRVYEAEGIPEGSMCVYWTGGDGTDEPRSCACLFGWAFDRIRPIPGGPTLLEAIDSDYQSLPIGVVLNRFGLCSDQWCSTVQWYQDHRIPWARCVEKADNKFVDFGDEV